MQAQAQLRRNIAHGLERTVNVEQPNERTVGVFGVKNHREAKILRASQKRLEHPEVASRNANNGKPTQQSTR